LPRLVDCSPLARIVPRITALVSKIDSAEIVASPMNSGVFSPKIGSGKIRRL
jgi:hypothetical protein